MKYEISKYHPIGGKLLVEPMRMRTRNVETIELDEEKNKEKDPLKDEMEVKKVQTKAPFEIQLATVIAVPKDNRTGYEVGNTIVYSVKFVKEFDLFKKTFLISLHDIHGEYEL